MASGRRHWQVRLVRLGRLRRRPQLRRAQRRQLRKLLGRAWGLEWRSLGNVRGGLNRDALNTSIVGRARTIGHVVQRLAEQRGQA